MKCFAFSWICFWFLLLKDELYLFLFYEKGLGCSTLSISMCKIERTGRSYTRSHMLVEEKEKKLLSFCLKLHRKAIRKNFYKFRITLKWKREKIKTCCFILLEIELILEKTRGLSRCMQGWDWNSTDDFPQLTSHYIQNIGAIILPFLGLM